MSKIDRDKLIRFLQEKWQGRTCPMCQHGNWNVSEQVFEMREFNDGNLRLGGNSSILPLIPVTCSKCGNTIFVNAIVAGLVKNNVDKGDEMNELNKRINDKFSQTKQESSDSNLNNYIDEYCPLLDETDIQRANDHEFTLKVIAILIILLFLSSFVIGFCAMFG